MLFKIYNWLKKNILPEKYVFSHKNLNFKWDIWLVGGGKRRIGFIIATEK